MRAMICNAIRTIAPAIVVTVLCTTGYGVQFALIDIGASGQRIEPGALEFSGSGNGQNNNLSGLFTADTGHLFTAALTNVNQTGGTTGNLDWRDRGNNNNDALVALGEDHIKNNGGVIRLTLNGLPAGSYDATSYHHDQGFTQSDMIEVHVNTGGGFVNTGAVGTAGAGGGTNTAVVDGSKAEFSFTANGTDPVAIVFDGRPSSDNETPLNGINLFATTALGPPGPPPPSSSRGGFTMNQTDASTGNGSVAVFHEGILFGGPLGTPTVTQLDPAPGGPVPAGAVGHVTTGTTGNPGGNGPHAGYSGSVVIQGHIRDDLDPRTATSDPAVTNVYEITVPLTMVTGTPHNYVFNAFDDNGAGNDVTNSLTHRGWPGDPGDGHRHSDGTFGYGVGPDTFTASADFNLANGASGDSLGISAGVGGAAPSPGALFIDDIHFRGILESAVQNATLVGTRRTAFGPVINSVSLTGTGLAPEGAVVENGSFGEDALMFTDRTHEWNSTGGTTIADLGLEGADYIRFANDDRSPADLMAVIGLEPGPKDLYLLIDSRISNTNVANILNGHPFADTGLLIGADESGDGDIDQTSRLFMLTGFEDVFIELGPQGQGGTNNYGFIAVAQPLAPVPEPATATLSLLGLAGLALRRRRRA